jgi:mevalonate kinase
MTLANGPGFGHGKIILMGEHAVVYGYEALAASISTGVTIRTLPSPDGMAVRIDDWQLAVQCDNSDHPVVRAALCVAEHLDFDMHQVMLDGKANLPAGAGLGSSAAMAVAMAKAMAPTVSNERICVAANAAEQIFHDNPSGVDVALACHGGAGIFCKQAGFTPLALPSFRIAIGMTGQSRNTKTMVQQVAAQVDHNPQDARLQNLQELTMLAHAAWGQSKWSALGQLCNQGQRVLTELTVSTSAIDALCATAINAGAWGAKLTGAGGGGSVIAIAENPDEVVKAWRSHGFGGFVTTIAGGARQDKPHE